MSEPHGGNSSVSEPHTRNVNVSEPHTRNVNVSEPHTRNVNVSKPHTRNVSEPHTWNDYPPPQPPAQLSPNRRIILWLALENGNGGRARQLLFVRYSYMHSEKSSLVLIVVLIRLVYA